MKTLRFFAVLCIILGSASKNANSQPIRTEYPVRIGFFVPCVNEMLIGNIIAERVAWLNLNENLPNPYSKIQLKYDDVVVYGQRSHLEYTLNFISNCEWEGSGAYVNHFVRMVIIRLDGKLIAQLPLLVHKTTTPDGEVVVNINEADIRCF